eukprot:gene10121-3147_t
MSGSLSPPGSASGSRSPRGPDERRERPSGRGSCTRLFASTCATARPAVRRMLLLTNQNPAHDRAVAANWRQAAQFLNTFQMGMHEILRIEIFVYADGKLEQGWFVQDGRVTNLSDNPKDSNDVFGAVRIHVSPFDDVSDGSYE